MAEAKPIIDASVDNPLPIGARDLLPGTTRRRRAVTESLLASFESWGFREVMPPLIEYFEVLGRGLGNDERERCVRFIEAGTGELVGLRSDVTPQIARMVAQRVGGTVGPEDQLRLCYAATLVRLPAGRHDRAELHQVGVEHVGEDEPTADAELVALADAALCALGSRTHRFDLAHTAVVRDVFAELGLSPAAERALRGRLARKDHDGLARALETHGVSGRAGRAVVALTELHGDPKLLAEARKLLAPVGGAEAVDRLRAVVDTIAREHPSVGGRISVDLGEVRGFDYYTGLRMRVWAPGSSEPVVRGGRYDDMLGRYGAALPAIGFAVELDALEEALVAGKIAVDGEALPSARLVALAPVAARTSKRVRAALRAAAVAESRDARKRGLRAWIDNKLALEAAQDMADRRGAERMTWLRVDGRGAKAGLIRERWRRGKSSWRRESSKRLEARDPS